MGEIDNITREFLQQSNAIERVYDGNSLMDAIDAWNYLNKQKELNPSVILITHKLLMRNQAIPKQYHGEWRDCPVYIGGHEALKWQVVPDRIEIWAMNAWLYPDHWKEHHIEYEKIHPFLDGNGRTGRMFMNWQRLKAGLPILVIHEGQEQMEYYKWFKT